MQTPTLGRIVLARVDPAANNGADLCPAIITRVWGPAAHNGHEWTTVNLRLFGDAQASVGNATSTRLFADQDAAENWVDDQDHPDTAALAVAYWPPRVG